MIIDADAHVIETDVTWDYVPEEDLASRPLVASGTDAKGQPHSYWLVDGHARPQAEQRPPPLGRPAPLDNHEGPRSFVGFATTALARCSSRASKATAN
jgi:hypothetical protein